MKVDRFCEVQYLKRQPTRVWLPFGFEAIDYCLFSHSEIFNIVDIERYILNQARAGAAFGALAADTDQQAVGVVVFIKSHHVSLVIVDRVVACNSVGVRWYLKEYRRNIQFIMIVVVRCALCPDRYYAVHAVFILLKA